MAGSHVKRNASESHRHTFVPLLKCLSGGELDSWMRQGVHALPKQIAACTWSQLPYEFIELIVARLAAPDCNSAWQVSRHWARTARQTACFEQVVAVTELNLITSLRRLHKWRKLHPLLKLRVAFRLTTPLCLGVAGGVVPILDYVSQVNITVHGQTQRIRSCRSLRCVGAEGASCQVQT